MMKYTKFFGEVIEMSNVFSIQILVLEANSTVYPNLHMDFTNTNSRTAKTTQLLTE